MTLEVIPTGKTTATVLLTQDQVDALRGEVGRGRVPLAITFKGATFRTSVSVYRGEWMMVVNAQMRDGGLTPGGSYVCDVTMDGEERVVNVPDDLRLAIENSGLTKRWDALAYTHRKEHVRAVEEAKKEQTRMRRIEKVVQSL
jgi:hypothetical protein